jgi:DNA-directed RNA polymerase specialized sigma24 family protein
MFLSKPEAQQIVDKGIGRQYIGQMMKYQWITKSSQFSQKYRQQHVPFSLSQGTAEEIDNFHLYQRKYLERTSTTQDSELEERAQKEESEELFLERVWQWLDQPENWFQRELYFLRYVQGESVSSIARSSHIPRGTLNKHYSELKRELQRIYQENIIKQ